MDSFTIILDDKTVSLTNKKGVLLFEVFCKNTKYTPEMVHSFEELLQTFIVKCFIPVEVREQTKSPAQSQ